MFDMTYHVSDAMWLVRPTLDCHQKNPLVSMTVFLLQPSYHIEYALYLLLLYLCEQLRLSFTEIAQNHRSTVLLYNSLLSVFAVHYTSYQIHITLIYSL